jgi:hypothetical protein
MPSVHRYRDTQGSLSWECVLHRQGNQYVLALGFKFKDHFSQVWWIMEHWLCVSLCVVMD